MSETKYAGVILAAGKGTRMNEGLASPIPKVMFELNGKPIIYWAVKLLQDAGIERIALVVGYKQELIRDYFKDKVEYAFQAEQLGTGHAVAQAKYLLGGQSDAVIVFYGDHALWKPETVRNLMAMYEREKPAVAILSVIFDNPEFWAFGRIEKDAQDNIMGIVEQKDCNPGQLKITECNPGFYIFDAKWLWENIDSLENQNAQKEFYLTDMIGMAISQGKKVVTMPVSDHLEAPGINTQEQLKEAEEVLKSRDAIQN